jgi:hypothetical protein
MRGASTASLASLVTILTSVPAPAQVVFGTTSNSGPQKVIALDTKTGLITTVMTGFNQLGGLAFDPLGNLYIAEQNSSDSLFHVLKFNRGSTPYSFTNAGVILSGIAKPLSSYGVCMVFDKNSNLFAGRFFDPQRGNGITEYYAGGGTRDFTFPNIGIPSQLDISYATGTERLYVADAGANRILFTPDPLANSALGQFVHLAGVLGVTTDKFGNVLASTSGANGVQKFDSTEHPLGQVNPQPGINIVYDPITGNAFENDVALYRIPAGGGPAINLTPNDPVLWPTVQFLASQPLLPDFVLPPSITITLTAVPEPSSLLTAAFGLAGALRWAGRRANRRQVSVAGRQ